MSTSGVLLASNGENLSTAPKQNRTKSSFFFNLKFGTQLAQIYGFDFLAGLEFNMFQKIYILCKILFIFQVKVYTRCKCKHIVRLVQEVMQK